MHDTDPRPPTGADPTLRATLPAGTEAPTLDIATHFLAPAGAGVFTGHGRLRRKGRGIAFLDADLLDESGVEVATATATFRIRSSAPKPD